MIEYLITLGVFLGFFWAAYLALKQCCRDYEKWHDGEW